MALEAVQRLAGLGNETFVRVKPAMWYHFLSEIYFDPAGDRYRIVHEQQCWVLIEMSDRRDWSDPASPIVRSPILLLANGTIGRFWPTMQLTTDPERRDRYVSTTLLPAITTYSPLVRAGESNVAGVKRRLADAIVDYERRKR